MKSGMLAAEATFEELAAGYGHTEASSYQSRFEDSWLFDELNRSRNVGPALHKFGVLGGSPMPLLISSSAAINRGRYLIRPQITRL